MRRAHKRDFVIDSAGNIVSGATVRVEDPATGDLITETLYTADTGAGTTANPLTTDTNGMFEFYTIEPRRVQLRGSKSGYTTGTMIMDVLNADTFIGFPKNVKAFGAVGDGVVNDAVAIQAAIDAAATGGVVFFPPGTYRYTATLTLASSIAIVGAGRQITVLSPAGAINGLTGSSQSDICIENLTLNGANQTDGYGIALTSCSRTSMHNCELTATWDSGVIITGGSDVFVTDCIIHNIGDAQATSGGAHGILIQDGASRVRLAGNHIYDCTRQYSHGITCAITASSSYTYILIIGNIIENCGRAASGGGGIQCSSSSSSASYRGQHITVTSNTIRNAGDGGIWIQGDYVTCTENTIDTTRVGPGIEVEDSRYVTINANVIYNVATKAIWGHNGTTLDLVGLFDVAINSNVIDTAGDEGIYIIDDGTGHRVARLAITGNVVRNCQLSGIITVNADDITIADNNVFDNDQSASGAGGIRVWGTAATNQGQRICISGNRAGDSRTAGSKTQDSGIQLSNECDYITVLNNQLDGNKTTPLNNQTTGSTLTIRNNTGCVTENSGTGTINSGATTAVVTHGLSVTPALKDINISFGENPSNDPGNWWISNITATQFTLNVRNDPGVSNLDFAWQAVVL